MTDTGISIKLGDSDNSKEEDKNRCKGPCPTTWMDTASELGGYAPIILGTMLTAFKMDQFMRPLANTAVEMLSGLPPQIEHNGEKITEIVNGITGAQQNLKKKLAKGAETFTLDDRAHLIQLLIKDESNYIDSYDTAMEFIKQTNPGLISAIYKSLVANNNKDNKVVHGESEQAEDTLNKQRGDSRLEPRDRSESIFRGDGETAYWHQFDAERKQSQRELGHLARHSDNSQMRKQMLSKAGYRTQATANEENVKKQAKLDDIRNKQAALPGDANNERTRQDLDNQAKKASEVSKATVGGKSKSRATSRRKKRKQNKNKSLTKFDWDLSRSKRKKRSSISSSKSSSKSSN